MGNILLFILFLIVYLLYLWVSYFLFVKYVNKLKGDNLLDVELIIVVSNIFLFAFLFIIGQFFNLSLVVISILASNAGLLIAFIIWSLLGSPKVPYKAISGWAGYDFGVNNPKFYGIIQILSLLVIIAFPIVVGIYYFSAASLEGIRIFTLKSTLILILGSYLLLMPTIINVLSAPFIDEDSRSRYLIAQFSGLIPNALFVSLLFWVFGWSSGGGETTIGNVSFTFNPYLFLALMLFFLLFLLLPYFIGVQKTKRLQQDLLQREEALLNNIVETVDLAAPQTIITKLEGLLQLVEKDFIELRENEKSVQTGLLFDNPDYIKNLRKDEVLTYAVYTKARPYDKRFIYYDFLNNTYVKLSELHTAVSNENAWAQNEETLEAYSKYFKGKKEALEKSGEKNGKGNPALWMGIIALASPFISQLMTEVGKYLLEYFKKI